MKREAKGEAKAGKEPKKRPGLVIKIAVAVVLIAAAAFLIKWAGDFFRAPKYVATAPTPQKFARIAKWVPKGAEFEISVDVPKALADAALRDRIGEVIKRGKGVAADFVAALIDKQDTVGMLMLTGKLSEPQTTPAVVIVAQGGFDKKLFIPAIRAVLAAGRAGLVSSEVGGKTLFYEGDSRDPFGFIILDDEHIAVGTREALTLLYREKAGENVSAAIAPDAVIFGRLEFGPRLKAALPAGLDTLSGIDFMSSDARKITARVPTATPEDAAKVQMFVEGVRSLLMIQQEDNPVFGAILKGVEVSGGNREVILTCDLVPLIDLWVPAEKK